MQQILTIAQTISPIGIIFIMAVIIYQLIKGKDILNSIFNTQQKKYPIIESNSVTLESLNEQVMKIADNHLHELPMMKVTIDKIASDVSFIKDNYGNRLTRVETILDNKK